MAIFETYAICIYQINLQLTGSGWSLVSVVEWSGGQVVRAGEMFMMARVVQVVQTVPVVPMVLWSKSGQSGWSRWSGSQLVRVVRVHDLDDMLSEIIWLSCPKSLLNN